MSESGNLFSVFSKRLDWLSQRQSVLAQNIANADTPNYRPQDLKKGSFEAALRENMSQPDPARTSAGHLGGANGSGAAPTRDEKKTYERSPDGNQVIMEEQLMKLSRNQMQHSLMVNLYGKYAAMFRMALGRDR